MRAAPDGSEEKTMELTNETKDAIGLLTAVIEKIGPIDLSSDEYVAANEGRELCVLNIDGQLQLKTEAKIENYDHKAAFTTLLRRGVQHRR